MIDTAEVTVAMLLIADEVRALAVSHHHAAIADAAASSAAAMLPAERAESDAPGVYYRRELLTRSLEGRRIDLITISGSDSQESKCEAALPPPLLPGKTIGRARGPSAAALLLLLLPPPLLPL